MGESPSVERRLTHVPALDGVRGLAVLLVVMRHLPLLDAGLFSGKPRALGFINGGYLGVDVFFVLSGFLITSLLLAEQTDRGRASLRNFYGRRALRLIPGLLVMLGVFVLVRMQEGQALSELWPSLRATLLYYLNWHAVWDSSNMDPNLGHLWSLSIEEQFYLLWPIVLATITAFSKKHRVRIVLIALVVVWVAWYRREIWQSGTGWVEILVRTDARLDTILIGCIAAVVHRAGLLRGRVLAMLGWAGLAGICASVAFTSPLTGFVYEGGFTLIALCAAAVILAVAGGEWGGSRVFSVAPLRAIGRVSYGLYLWHLPVFLFVTRQTPDLDAKARILLGLVVSATLTVASWFIVERPALRLKDRWFTSRHVADLRATEAPTSADAATGLRRVLAATLPAAAVTTLIVNVWPRTLTPTTDHMGYALVNNFTLGRYWQICLLWVLLFPLLVAFGYVVIPRVSTGSRFAPIFGDGPLRRMSRVEAGRATDTDTEHLTEFAAVARVAVLGATLGLLFASGSSRGEGNGWWWLAAGGGIYVVFVEVVARSRPFGFDPRRARGCLNLVASSSLPLALWWATRTTTVTQSSDRAEVNFAWLPLLPLVAVTVVIFATDLRRIATRGEIFGRERRRFVYFVVPTLLFVWVSRLPGTIGGIDVFHQGESLNGALLWANGLAPWRDFFFNVGFYAAVAAPRLAFHSFGTSLWGLVAGTHVYLIPLLCVSIYLACVALVSRYWLAIVAVTLFLMFPGETLGGFLRILNGDSTLFIFRFTFLFPFVIAQLMFLRRPTWLRSIFFGITMVANILAGSEMIVFAVGACLMVFIRDLAEPRINQGVMLRFRRTFRAAVGATVGLLCGAAALASLGSLGAYIEWWRTVPFDWYIETAIPIGIGTNLDSFRWGTEWVAFFAVPMSIIAVIWFAIWRYRSRRPLLPEDWTICALALGNLLFFQKALNRPDSHVYQSLITSIPVLFYVVVRLVEGIAAERDAIGAPRFVPMRRVNAYLTALLIVGLFPFMPVAKTLKTEVATAGERWKPIAAPAPSDLPRIGYTDDADFVETARQVRAFIERNLGEDAVVYDFANASGLYNFVLDYKPLNRYSYVLQVSTKKAMKEVIDTFRQRNPQVVVFGWESTIDEWDAIPNFIRHYDLGEYILRNYTPWASVGEKDYEQHLWLRNDLRPGYLMSNAATPALEGDERITELVEAGRCDWGTSVAFLSTTPEERTVVEARPVESMVDVFGWVPTKNDDPVEVIIRVNGSEVYRGVTAGLAGDVANRGVRVGANSAFSFQIPVVERIDDTAVTVEAVGKDQSSSSLPRTAGPGERDATGEFNVKVSNAVDGVVPFGIGQEPRHLLRIDYPNERRNLSWLVVGSDYGFADTKFALYDGDIRFDRVINFRALAREHVAGAQVGSCPVWHAWTSSHGFLVFDHVVLEPEVSVATEPTNR